MSDGGSAPGRHTCQGVIGLTVTASREIARCGRDRRDLSPGRATELEFTHAMRDSSRNTKTSPYD